MEIQKIFTDNNGLVTAFAESRIGGRSENQDSYGWHDTPLGYVVTVCDGMGGGPGGKTASTIAVREIVKGLMEAALDEEPRNVVIKAIRQANLAIIAKGNDMPEYSGMGSTATVLLLNAKSAIIAHVGDSRVYQLRGNKKVFRTFDHSMVFEMVAQGVITEEQARLSAQSNVITRALGIKPDVEVDVIEVPYLKGDRFLLCTDGIHGSMSERELLKAVTVKDKLPTVVDNVATNIDNIGRTTGGGHDNLTIAMVETHSDSKLKYKMTKTSKYIITGLLLLTIVSVVLNIIQTGKAIYMANENTAYRDSLHQRDTVIDELQTTVAKIEEVTRKTNTNEKDSLKKDINAIKQLIKKTSINPNK